MLLRHIRAAANEYERDLLSSLRAALSTASDLSPSNPRNVWVDKLDESKIVTTADPKEGRASLRRLLDELYVLGFATRRKWLIKASPRNRRG